MAEETTTIGEKQQQQRQQQQLQEFLAEPVRIDPGCSYRHLGEKDGFFVLLLCYQRLVDDGRGRFGGDVRVRV